MARNTNYLPAGADPVAARAAFAERLRVRINQRLWTQSQFARASGIPRDSVSNYVRGNTWPDPQNLQRICRTLECEPAELIPATVAPQDPGDSGVMSAEGISGSSSLHLRINRRVTLNQATRILSILAENNGQEPESEPIRVPSTPSKPAARKRSKRR